MASAYMLRPTISKTGSKHLGNLVNEQQKYRIGSCKYGNIQSKKWQVRSGCQTVHPVIQPIVPLVIEKKVGPCGGSGGRPRDMDLTGVTHIVKVGIRHCDTVDALIVHFERYGRQECTDLWGEQGGRLTEICLQPNEYITSVRGHLGYFKHIYLVRSLTLETNLRTCGPFGQEDGIPFELSVLDGEIIGFYGRSGTYLDAIGIYVKAQASIQAHSVSTEEAVETAVSFCTSTVTVEETNVTTLVEGTETVIEETIEETCI